MVIRSVESKDYDKLVEIWLKTSIQAHDFIDAEYWDDKVAEIRKTYLPKSENFVIENDSNRIIGFVSLLDDFIAALFISTEQQEKGFGTRLLQFVKSRYHHLSLNVYKKNLQAMSFYKKHGFYVVEESVDEDTGELDLLMEWNK